MPHSPMTQSRHLFSDEGHWVAFLVGNDVFWRDGERLGWFHAPGGEVPTSQCADHVAAPGWRGGIVKSTGGKSIGMISDQSVLKLEVTDQQQHKGTVS